MLAKLLVALVVFLEILNVPSAGDKTEKWARSVLNEPITEKPQTLTDENWAQILPYPHRKPSIKDPLLEAEGAIVIDLPTSKILFQKNLDKRFSLASLTKIMTALIVLENYNPSDVIVVPKEATLLPGAKINLKTGERLTVESLLYGLLLYSGNDAAYTLASKMGKEEFVFKMNQKAKDLGLYTLRFSDPTGLDPNNSTTPKDLAFLASFALKNPKFAQIVKTNEFVINSVDGRTTHPLRNTNRLLREYPGTFGVKTGYTEEAGHNLISAVERDNHKVLSVVLKNPSNQFKESEKLLDWVFSAYIWD